MIDFIQRYVPDWLIRVLIGIAMWVAVCHFFITPFLYDRVTLPLRSEYSHTIQKHNDFWRLDISESAVDQFSSCLYRTYYKAFAIDFTLWVASATFYQSDAFIAMSQDINSPVFITACGDVPWKTK